MKGFKTMKKTKRIALSVIALLLAVTFLGGCSSLGKPMMTLGDSELTVNMVSLFLSRLKGTLSFSAAGEVYWDTIVDNKNGITYNDFYTAQGMDAAKTYLAAMHVFEERGLTLPKSAEDAVDEKIDRLIEEEGSRVVLNEKLAEYGANVKILREIYLIEEKMAYLIDDLYGADGSLIAKKEKDDYYKEHYRRFKQIFLPLYEFVYEENGEGEQVKVRDEDGNYKIRELTEAETLALEEKKDKILASAKSGDYAGFDALVTQYDEEPDEASKNYPNGFYLSEKSNYKITAVSEALFEMETGEIRTVIPENGYGVYIIMRYENEESGYASEKNKDFFGDFTELLKNHLIGEYLNRYLADIQIDTEAAKGVDIKSVGANVYY